MRGETLLITGGTGFIGKALLEHYLKSDIKKIIILSRDEYKQSEMKRKYTDDRIRYFLGDVRDYERLTLALKGVDYIIHTAAMKRIESCEYDPLEAIKTNVQGTANIIRAAIECRVKKVLNISTDKAVNPSCLYGSTKQLAEKLIVDANNYSQETRFANVRCGNFIGSTGSVVPLYRELIKKGHTQLPVTDCRMTRYWMETSDGIDLIHFALTDMTGGETYTMILKSFKVTDLAEAFGVGWYEIGKRPGEKLHEQMIDENENTVEYDYGVHVILKDPSKLTKNIEMKSDINYFMTKSEIKERLECNV